jgi:hypothetical protein
MRRHKSLYRPVIVSTGSTCSGSLSSLAGPTSHDMLALNIICGTYYSKRVASIWESGVR